jgi:agmatine/peptidylarginine deiminase
MGNFDSWSPLFKVHSLVMQHLPASTKLLLYISEYANENSEGLKELRKNFKREFNSGRFKTVIVEHGNNWVRDYFPETIRLPGGKKVFASFHYDRPDQEVTDEMYGRTVETFAKSRGAEMIKSSLNLEGGNLLATEKGTVFVSDTVIARNPGWTEDKIRSELLRMLHAKEIVFLPPLPLEGTGHIDLFARLVSGNRILVSSSENPKQRTVLNRAAAVFEKQGFQVIRVPMGNGFMDTVHYRYANLSYVNSQIIGNTAFIPAFGMEEPDAKDRNFPDRKWYRKLKTTDAAAAKIYRDLGFKVVQIPAFKLSGSAGLIHCLTKQYVP